MTYQQYVWRIEKAAYEAAIASFDAHGEFVAPHMAYDFIREVWADEDGSYALPEAMPKHFRTEYERNANLIRSRSPFIMAHVTRQETCK